MGSEERKSKTKTKKHSYSSSSSEDDERRSKRRRHSTSRTSDGESSKPADESHNKKKKEKRHHRSRPDKEMKSGEKRKSKHQDSDSHVMPDFRELSSDDYYIKNNEFATWLKEERDQYFSDLTSESAHDLFKLFVKDWNNQKLESRYYKGIASAPRTSHKWKIKKK